MEDTGELRSASRVYEAQLERTFQELNRRKGELEDALHQVSFMAMPSYDSFAKFIIVEGICSWPWRDTFGRRLLGNHDKGIPGHN